MFTCPQCKENTLKFQKGDLALFVNVVPDSQHRPNYKSQYVIVKILGNKCFPSFNFDKRGNAQETKTHIHDYICSEINSKSNFPVHESHLHEITEANQIMKELVAKE